jgi:hypothetical protein
VPGSKKGTAVSVNSFTVDISTAKMKGEVNGTGGNRDEALGRTAGVDASARLKEG